MLQAIVNIGSQVTTDCDCHNIIDYVKNNIDIDVYILLILIKIRLTKLFFLKFNARAWGVVFKFLPLYTSTLLLDRVLKKRLLTFKDSLLL